MPLNCGAGENSYKSLGQQADQTSQSEGKSPLNTHWKDWCWSWNSSILVIWWEQLTHWKSPWCWEILRAEGEEGVRGWDGWMASPMQWTWTWANSRRWWGTEKPAVLHPRGCKESDVTRQLDSRNNESWTIKKAERQRLDAFALWCWRRLLSVLWATRRLNQSILKRFNPEYSLEGLMLKLKLQCFGHLMQRADSLEKTLMLGKIEGGRRRGWQRMRGLDSITSSMDVNFSKLWEILKQRGV